MRIVVVAAALPSLATLIFEWTIGVVPSNTIRLLAGLPIGVAVSAAIAVAGDIDGRGASNR